MLLASAAAFHFAVQPESTDASTDPLTDPEELADIKKLSHGVAIVLLFSAYRILHCNKLLPITDTFHP